MSFHGQDGGFVQITVQAGSLEDPAGHGKQGALVSQGRIKITVFQVGFVDTCFLEHFSEFHERNGQVYPLPALETPDLILAGNERGNIDTAQVFLG